MERGILGVKKDPKKPILCLINGETWPSDDSDDEDYAPNADDRNAAEDSAEVANNAVDVPRVGKFVIKRFSTANGSGLEKESFTFCRKRRYKEKTPNVERLKKDRTEKKQRKSEVESSDYKVNGRWFEDIPIIILIKIFDYIVSAEGVLPFLQRASQVCDLWKEAAEDCSLWTCIDVSKPKVDMSEMELLSLCQDKFDKVLDLNLSGWGGRLSSNAIKEISKSCPRLTNLNLSGCERVTGSIMKLFVDNCPKLTSIDLSHTWLKASSNLSPVSNASLKYITTKVGDRLVRLNLAGNDVVGFSGIVTIIAENCPELRELDVSVQTRLNGLFNVEELQEGCTKLKILRLMNFDMRFAPVPLAQQAASLGFPELEELSVGRRDLFYQAMDDSYLERVLKTSHKLKILDIRGCGRVTASGLVRLPAWHLEHLFLSQCPGVMTPDLELVMQKWSHSLNQVDLSWNNQSGEVVDLAVKALTMNSSQSPLRSLDLCGSAVSFEPVKAVLCNCPNLSVFNLSSCRGLPRGIKRVYKGDDLQKLRVDIEAFQV